MTKKVFISKHDHEVADFKKQLSESDFQLISESFLRFQTTEFNLEKNYDIIFFGSIRSVIFLRAGIDLGNAKAIACIGTKTASILTELGHPVDFVGKSSGDPSQVAKDFKKWCGNRRVLFPLSNRSLKSISSVFPAEQVEETVVYQTELIKKEIQQCDIYIFTSPSNVKGFLLQNDLPEICEVIAWGKSTEQALMDVNINADYCLEESSFRELIEHLRSK